VRDLESLAAVAEAAVQLGRGLVHSSSLTTIRNKGDRDTVTNVDLTIEREVRAYLHEATPGIGFLGEEDGGSPLTASNVWILDPIDGTANFAHGVPLCAISLALVRDGEPVVAVIDAPFLDLRYIAAKGNGARANSRAIHASTTSALDRAIVAIGDYAVGSAAVSKNPRRLRLTAALAERVERIRMFGTAALDLAWVAEGRIDAAVMLSNKPWDTAAGVLIAREAGAHVTDIDGVPHTFTSTETVAASPAISNELLAIFAPGEAP
jgi:myo-inositol-1(or 4)-monophosphatase